MSRQRRPDDTSPVLLLLQLWLILTVTAAVLLGLVVVVQAAWPSLSRPRALQAVTSQA